MQYSHRKDCSTAMKMNSLALHETSWMPLTNIVSDTEARHEVNRADYSLYIKFKNRSTTLHNSGIRHRRQNYKEKQGNRYHQSQESGCLCRGRKEIIIRKGQLEGFLGVSNVLFLDLGGILQDFIFWFFLKMYSLFYALCCMYDASHNKIFLKFLFIYLFIYLWPCWVFVSVRGLSPVAASGGHSSSRCAGLSLSRPLLLRSTGSRRAGSVVVAHGVSCSTACGIFLDQGSNPCALHWQADSQPLCHTGSPHNKIFKRRKRRGKLEDVNTGVKS